MPSAVSPTPLAQAASPCRLDGWMAPSPIAYGASTPSYSPRRAVSSANLSWKCRRFRCRTQLVLTTWCRIFPTRRPNTANVSATSCDVGFFFSVSYVVSLPNCRNVVVGTTTTYPFLSCSGWRHLSCSCFCHVLVGAKSIITRASSFSL